MQWTNTTVGDFCPFVYGKAIKKQDQLNKGIPVYGSNGIYTYSANELVSPYTVVIGRKGSVGKLHISFTPCWVSDTAFYVKQETLEETYFTYYLLSTLGLENMNTDAAVPGLNRDNAHRLKVRIPESAAERKRLIAPLIALDKKINLNNEINQTLEQMAQAIFKSWFVDFEPVKAKIAALEAGGNQDDALLAAMQAIAGEALFANNPTNADAATQLAQLKANNPEQYASLRATAELFPSAMQDNELGEIPEGWDVKALDEIAHYQNGLALQKFRPENDEESLPVLKIAQLRKGFADGEERASANIKAECIVNNSDVVFSWSGSLIVDIWCGGKVALNQHLFKVSSQQYPKWFYYYWTKHHLEAFQQIASDKAVTMGHIKREHLSQAKCLIPTDIFLTSPLIGELLDKQVKLRLENITLANLRDTLLPKLLSGELSLAAAEEQLADTVEPAHV